MIALTDDGFNLMKNAFAEFQAVYQTRLEKLTADDHTELVKAMNLLQSHLFHQTD